MLIHGVMLVHGVALPACELSELRTDRQDAYPTFQDAYPTFQYYPAYVEIARL